MGLFSGIGKALGGIGKALGGIGKIAKALGGILNSPLGGLLKMVFPPLGMASGVLNFAGMMGSLAGGIGGGKNY
ncbi:MAG: hypothetical protein Q4G24_08925 [Paracoccus sp. (in: a-proteobacteria)]|uniref:hypothetical protein n=1 Tax=Paracoccus sp. TaxID=267 RepID=UPI0026E0C602|nr:hypothetical protein [Paracoccus sp. (in: a-proteobacteria)]MDO5621577.1 hypothetical protein [Paracoccus sp. (in: a-proteobacteria)]